MGRMLVLCVGVVGWCAVGAAPAAAAMRYSGFGGTLGYTSPDGVSGTMIVGMHAEFQSTSSPFQFVPGVTYWSEDGLSDLGVNADVQYHFLTQGTVTPYVGAGLGLHAFGEDRGNRSHTDLGANVFGGLRFPNTSSQFFLETRLAASDVSQVAFVGGITFH